MWAWWAWLWKHNSELAFPWQVLLLAGLWWWPAGTFNCAHPGFSLQCYWLIPQFTKKKLSITHNLNCVMLGGAEWSWWSPLALICALGFLNSTVLSNWLCFHMDVSDHGITQRKTVLWVLIQSQQFLGRYLLPTKPFLVHFRSPRITIYNVLCCGYFVVLQK